MSSPAVTVLIPAYNAAQYIGESVHSVLSQTLEDFEIVVVDDGSADQTRDILSCIRDARLRVIFNEKNLGIVRSLNKGFAAARGQYVARLDADDYSTPDRLLAQKAFLDKHQSVVMVGSGGWSLTSGKINALRIAPEADPAVLRWLLHILNPIGHSSMMFRRDVVLAMNEYLREDFEYAEDFEFSHRLLGVGTVAMLPAQLVVFRRLPGGMSRLGVERVLQKTTTILEAVYSPLLGQQATEAAAVISAHLMAGRPMMKDGEFERLANALELLVDSFFRINSLSEGQRVRVLGRTAELWWHAVLSSARLGAPAVALRCFNRFRWWAAFRPEVYTCARAGVAGIFRSIPRASMATMSREDPFAF